MEEFILLFFFIFSFLIIMYLFYYLVMQDSKIEKRMNYYFDINKKYKDMLKKKEKPKVEGNILKGINEFIREKLSGINQEKLSHDLKGAGVHFTPEEYIMLKWFLTAVMGGVAYFLSNNIFLLVPGGIIGYVLPKVWIDRKRNVRVKKFNDGLPDMITTIIGSLRSGYSFSQALKTVAEECESPVKEEVMLLLKEMNYGITMEDALNNLNKRMESNDLELMVQAILIQRQVGGNLAGVLEIIVKTIRERSRIERQVQTLTAQGRLSGRVIGALPVVLGTAIYFLNPEYISTLFTNRIGIAIVTFGVISGVIGFILINKVTKIEV